MSGGFIVYDAVSIYMFGINDVFDMKWNVLNVFGGLDLN